MNLKLLVVLFTRIQIYYVYLLYGINFCCKNCSNAVNMHMFKSSVSAHIFNGHNYFLLHLNFKLHIENFTRYLCGIVLWKSKDCHKTNLLVNIFAMVTGQFVQELCGFEMKSGRMLNEWPFYTYCAHCSWHFV